MENDNNKLAGKYTGGLEERLATCSFIVGFLGYGAAIFSLFAFEGISKILAAVSICISTYITQTIFLYLAESIRIKKKELLLPYSGQISTANFVVDEFSELPEFGRCGICNDELDSDAFCQQCLSVRK